MSLSVNIVRYRSVRSLNFGRRRSRNARTCSTCHALGSSGGAPGSPCARAALTSSALSLSRGAPPPVRRSIRGRRGSSNAAAGPRRAGAGARDPQVDNTGRSSRMRRSGGAAIMRQRGVVDR